MAIETRVSKSDGKPRYLVRVEIRTPDGKRKQQRVGTFRSKKQAELAMAQALTKRESGTLLTPDKTTVAQLMDEWLAVKKLEVTSNSFSDYEVTVRRHIKPAMGQWKLQTVTPIALQGQYAKWIDAGRSARVVRGCHMRLRQAFDHGVRMRLLTHNPVLDTRPPRLPKGKFDYWNAAETRAFLEASKEDVLSPLWDLLAREGLRRGEALGIRWSDINWERGTIHLSQTVVPDKGKKGAAVVQPRTKTASGSRSVRLTVETLALLRGRMTDGVEGQQLVFKTSAGKPINPNNVTRSYNAIVQRAGVRRITVHQLRHTSATLLLTAGVPHKIVSERLGHASTAVTLDLYSHVTPDMQDEAARAMTAILSNPGPADAVGE